MRKFLLSVFFIFLYGMIYSQANDSLALFQKSFVKGSLQTKVEVIREAALQDKVNMGPLFLEAVDFIRGNTSLIANETAAKDLMILATTNLKEIKYTEAAASVWGVFENITEIAVKIACMDALGSLAVGNQALINNMNRWLDNTNNLFMTGTRPNEELLLAAINSLGTIKSDSSFVVLFSALNTGYSDKVNTLIKTSLLSFSDSLEVNLIRVLDKNPLAEKKAVLQLSADSSLSGEKKAQVASDALELALEYITASSAERLIVRELRYESAKILAENKWVQATPLLIQHFNKCIEEYDRKEGTKGSLLDAIAALGEMSSPEAVDRLILYIDLLNTFTENGQVYDEQITSTVVAALKKLGNKKAVNSLQYMTFLKYPESVKKAARDAITALKF